MNIIFYQLILRGGGMAWSTLDSIIVNFTKIQF